ncbi:D-alanyl-D-alanine carboxypeptidase [Clostridiaceae bacterium 35-E11]
MNRKMTARSIAIITIFFFLNMMMSYANTNNISASSAIVMDVKTGRILFEKNINQKKPMASTTKIMTALLALEKTPLEEIIKVPRNAVGVEGSSIYLQYDEKLSMKDLLYGLMLRSGNDAATAVAVHVSGSVEKFSDLMNKRARELGAINTNFMNPHGLHNASHYTTAYDLALITREALKNKNFSEIVQTKLWVAEREGYKYFYNKNKILSQYAGGNGVKTGYTKAAGRCLVTSATRNGMQLLCVVLNAPNWFQDSYQLLDNAFEKYDAVSIIKKDAILKTISVKNGKKSSTKLISTEDVVIPLTEKEKDKIRTVLDVNEVFEAPIARGVKLGKAKIYLHDQLLYIADLMCREDIGTKSFKDKVLDIL